MAYNVEIRCNDIATLIDLRGDPAALAGHLDAAHLELPKRPNARLATNEAMLFRVGPRRVLLQAGPGLAPALSKALEAVAEDLMLAAADISDAFVAFAVSGPDALDVMTQATPLDVSAETFPEDAASFTDVFGQAGLVTRAPGGFAIFIERSYADYIEACLRRAAG